MPPTPAQIADHHQRRRADALVRFTDRHPVITHNAAWAIKRWQEAQERAAAGTACAR